jgi:hypothetical protein
MLILSNEVMSPKKEGEMIFAMEIFDIGYTNSIGIVETSLKQKEGYYKSYFYI